MRAVLAVGVISWLMAAGQAPMSEMDARIKQARAEMASGDLVRARSEAEALHVADPKNVDAAVLLANCYIKLGRAPEAVTLLKPLEPGNSSNAELEYSLAFGEIQSGQANEGLPRLERVAEATHSANAWMAAGAARMDRKEFAKSREDLDKALAITPHLPGLNTLSGQIRHATESPETATPFFKEALKQNPWDFYANLYLGSYAMRSGDYAAARPLLELAVQIAPNAPLARLDLAELNGLTGRYDEAIATLESLERATPDWLEPHVRLAALYYKVHRSDDGDRERYIVSQLEARQQKAGPDNK